MLLCLPPRRVHVRTRWTAQRAGSQTSPLNSFGVFRRGLVAAVCFGAALGPTPARVSAASTPEPNWVTHVREDVAKRPVLRRPMTLAQLKADPGFKMKYREKPAHLAHVDEAGWERFALSLADTEAARNFTKELPVIAAAIQVSGDRTLLAHLRDQLEEIATWAPFERPGWSGGSVETSGAWLGTGWMVRALVQTLDHLPADALPPELRAALRSRFAEEIARIREDFETRRTWFARIEAASSNQWILPLEALALASLHNGLDQHRDDYEFAIRRLLRSLDAQGPDGECVEGLSYGLISFDSLLSAAVAAKAHGDERLFRHRWLQAFPTWYLHHRQPAGFVINAFDSDHPDLNWDLVQRCAQLLGDPAAAWALRHRPPESRSLESLMANDLARPRPAGEPPPPFAAYTVAARVNWVESLDAFRSGPASHVSGFWMRGGHESDAHDHEDRGHVNFIVAGRPVLIEAGLASYGIPEHPTHFRSVAGHNVLQVGDHAPSELTVTRLREGAGQILDPAHRSAPMDVHRLDPTGGEVSVDASGCYASVQRWVRTARWNADVVTVRDEVVLHEPDVILFRWHLGEPADAVVSDSESGRLRVGDVQLDYTVEPNADLAVSIESMPDRTLTRDHLNHHATVVMKTRGPVRSLTLSTRIALVPSAGRTLAPPTTFP